MIGISIDNRIIMEYYHHQFHNQYFFFGVSTKIALNNKRKKECFSNKSFIMVSICKVVFGCHFAYGTLLTSASEMALYSKNKRCFFIPKG